jgi:hypothetical protein
VISEIEDAVRGLDHGTVSDFLLSRQIGSELIGAAAEVKRVASQIDVTIHALGILKVLPYILAPEEIVESVSLGAGNTGRAFDLETNRRVAEFKFINWRGGAESIRQNGIFKDFFDLAAAETSKEKYLYLLGTSHAMKFLRGGRSLSSVLSKNEATRRKFEQVFGARYARVSDYFADHHHKVAIVDISPWLPELSAIQALDIESDAE